MLAKVTNDGYAKKIGDVLMLHPVYKTPSYELTVELPLSQEEADCYEELTQKRGGEARMHIRSALAQLGLDAFHPSALQMQRSNNVLVINTLVTTFNGEQGMRVLSYMRELLQAGEYPRFMHAGLLPFEARVQSVAEVTDACNSGALDIEHADVYEDGSIGLPPAPILYRFRPEVSSPEILSQILLGHGRATLASVRESEDVLPDVINAGDFLVTGVYVNTKEHHVVLRRQTIAQRKETPVVHGESCVLQAGRTRGGCRQLEIWNANGSPQPIAPLRVVADLYRAESIAEPGH